MYKLVNVIPNGPIFSLKVPVLSPMMGVQLSVGDIARCIHSRAIVNEILENGEEVRLNLSNYDKDNTPKKEKKETIETISINKVKDESKNQDQILASLEADRKAKQEAEELELAKLEAELKLLEETEQKDVEYGEFKINNVEIEEDVEEDLGVECFDADKSYFNELEKQKNKVSEI